jgi:hypothetical protein
MSIEAMKQALEAMTYADACLKKQLTTKTKHEYAQDLLLEAGSALRQAIEQAEQQAPICAHGVSKLKCDFCKRPEQAQPVAWISHSDSLLSWDKFYDHMEPLYTTPPQRQHWVSLTDKQLEEMAEKYVTNCYFDTLKYARAVEAELKEKNFVPSKLEAD